MRIDEGNNNHLIAGEGKVLCRISDGWISGTEVHLGYIYYLDGKRLETPIRELPEHYEEIDEPITEETVILSEDMDIIPVAEELVTEKEMEDSALKRVTLSDYMELKRTVEQLKEMIGR